VTRYIALLRGVNVSGHRRLSMAALRSALTEAGYEDVASYIQSGNIALSASVRSADALARAMARLIDDELGLSAHVLVRSATDMDRIVAKNPFIAEGLDPGTLHVTLLAGTPHPSGAVEVPEGPDRFERRGREVYLHCPNGYGRTPLNNSFWERRLGVEATTRNWRTMTRLLAMVHA
jgi:uncharacterized protein (DUF1697 family)